MTPEYAAELQFYEGELENEDNRQFAKELLGYVPELENENDL